MITVDIAQLTDVSDLVELFCAHVSEHPEYRSQGELLEAEDVMEDESAVEEYFMDVLSSPECRVFKAVDEKTGETVGLCSAGLEEEKDGGLSGTVYDCLLKEGYADDPQAACLTDKAEAWLREAGAGRIGDSFKSEKQKNQ